MSIKDRGCTGNSFHLDFAYDKDKKRFDEVVEQHGVKVVVDSGALMRILVSQHCVGVDVFGCGWVWMRGCVNSPNIAAVLVFSLSLSALLCCEQHSTMDFSETDEAEGFVFENPQAKGTCGCGESFFM